MTEARDPELSVVLAVTGEAAGVTEAAARIAAGCHGLRTELVIVGPGAVDPAPAGFVAVRHLACDDATLVPERWGTGARAARGGVVAFTTDQLRLDAGWGRAVVDAMGATVVGVGGPIARGTAVSAATGAAHLIRFSAFLPGLHPSRHVVPEIAGDNAAYERAAILRYPELLRRGFWEVEFHREFAREGRTLLMVPEARATLVGPVPAVPLIAQRFHHARAFGRARVASHGESALRIAFASPLVPAILLLRMRRRARADAEVAPHFAGLMPRLALLACSWALGEVVGALGSAGARRSAP